MKIGIVDIGSNTVRLVIYSTNKEQIVKKILDYKKMLQLLIYIDNYKLNENGIRILCDTLNEFRMIADMYDVDYFAPFATASLRFIDNKNEVLHSIKETVGVDVDMISGQEEATLGYYATYKTTKLSPNGLSVDVGGGSTELVYYEGEKAKHSISLPMGSLSLYLKHVHGLFPTAEESQALRDDINSVLDQVNWLNTLRVDELVGIGGSARAVTKVCKVLYTKDKINHGDTLPSEYLGHVANLNLNHEKKIAQEIIQTIVDRSTTLMSGTAILYLLAERIQAKNFVLSRNGIREGYLYKRFIEGKHE